MKQNEWRATFVQIEKVLGTDLPPSARKYRVWWSNTTSHSQAQAWMKAGWVTRKVNLANRSVVFERKSHDSSPSIDGKRQARQRRDVVSHSLNSRSTGGQPPEPAPANDRALVLLGQPFIWVANIRPKTRKDGTLWTDMPQARYTKATQTRLNRHGAGPFCSFDVRGLPDTPGIYAVTLNGKLTYVGIARKSLKQRWGPQGYARISPRNCYATGQSTNCKLNHAILEAALQKRTVELWIREMDEPRALEMQLIRELNPLWNEKG